eukprot:284129-Pelagomonas_calceolata.AAC.9
MGYHRQWSAELGAPAVLHMSSEIEGVPGVLGRGRQGNMAGKKEGLEGTWRAGRLQRGGGALHCTRALYDGFARAGAASHCKVSGWLVQRECLRCAPPAGAGAAALLVWGMHAGAGSSSGSRWAGNSSSNWGCMPVLAPAWLRSREVPCSCAQLGGGGSMRSSRNKEAAEGWGGGATGTCSFGGHGGTNRFHGCWGREGQDSYGCG